MPPENVRDTVRATLEKHGLFPPENRLVVGVSGGTDSLALLHLLTELARAENRPLTSLHVATLDHGLRGAAGADDARFVAETARAWGLQVTVGHEDTLAVARQTRVSIETAARMVRYRFLAVVARQQHATRVAVAHHADDQAETVLLHLLRGSGLAGLQGMRASAPMPGHADLLLIRPLLDVTRADLEAYCREEGLQPRHDATNDDTRLTRNRLRREIMPVLRGFTPQLERRLLQLAETAAVEHAFANEALHRAIDGQVERDDHRLRLPRAVLAALHPALQRRFVLWAAQSLGAEDVGYVHVTSAIEVALHGQVGGIAQLKSGVQLRLDYETVVIEDARADLPAENMPLLTEGAVIAVPIPGAVELENGWRFKASRAQFTGSTTAPLRMGKDSVAALRTRREGDRFAPIGLNGHHQKISEWMVDHKVPRYLRNRVPILEIDGEIAGFFWGGWVLSHDFVNSADALYVAYFDLGLNSDS